MRKTPDMRRESWSNSVVRLILPSIVAVAVAPVWGQVDAQKNTTQTLWPGKTWRVASSPEALGWSSEKLAAAKAYGDSIHTSAAMTVQGGEVVTQWGDYDKKITSYSIRKSLISALYGIYPSEGVINVSNMLEQLGIDDSPDPLTKQEKQARIVDLLRARSGVYHAVDFESPAQISSRPSRGSHAPGTFWFYNNWDFNVLGTIFEKKTGKKIGQAFYERIAKPISMQDFSPDDVFYLGGTESIHPAYLFEISTRDLARFGLLYLRHGRWEDKQIIPEDWIEKSTHANEMVQFGGKDAGGYEYLWWVEYGGKHLPEATLPGMYSARGAGGHYVLIIPTLDLVIVHRVDNDAPNKDVKSVIEQGLRPLVNSASFGHLVKLILEARTAEKPNPFVGTWKFVPERSHFDRTAPKDVKLVFLIDKDELREEEQVILSNGSTRTAIFIPQFDGLEHPFTMSGETKHKIHAVLWTRVDDRTIERRVNHDNGLEYTTERLSVSPDGKTLTETHLGKRPDGTPYETVITFARQ